jgi:elongation factor P
MDDETFEQIEIPIKKVKWEINFLKNESEVLVKKYKNEILNIELPLNVKLKVIEAPNAIRGNTQNNPQKKVKVETGYELKVPMFIKENESIIISSETGKYVGKGDK